MLSSVLQIYGINYYDSSSSSLLHTLKRAVTPHVRHLSVDLDDLAATHHASWIHMGGEFHCQSRSPIDSKIIMYLSVPGAFSSKSLGPYRRLITLTLMVSTKCSRGQLAMGLSHVGYIICALPPTVSRVTIDLTRTSSLHLSKDFFDDSILDSFFTRLAHWDTLDQIVNKTIGSLHPSLSHIRIVLPRASQKHINRWTFAIRGRLRDSMARSLFHVISDVSESDYLRCMILESNSKGLHEQSMQRPAGHITTIMIRS